MPAPPPPRNNSRPPACRPLLETLEDRWLPAVLTWVNPTGGSWHNPLNWDAGRLPGSGDDVVINLPGVSVSHTTGTTTVRSITGSQTLRVSGGTLHVLAASRLGTLRLSGGTVYAWKDLDVTGKLSWSGGKLAGSGQVDVLGDADVWGSTTKWLDRVRLHMFAATKWSGGGVRSANGAVLANQADGEFSVLGGTRFDAAFQNAGSFVFNAPGSVAFAAFANAGDVVLKTGTLQVTSYAQAAGVTTLSGGALAAGSPVTLDGGTLTGGGTVDADVVNRAAVVSPGAGQTLHVTGDYTQLSGGHLALVVSGVNVLGLLALPVGGSSLLRVDGTASLDGVLSAQVSGVSTPGQRYDLVTAADTQGQFAQVQTWPLPGLAYGVEYAADGADLVTALAVPVVNDVVAALPPAAGPTVVSTGSRTTSAGSGVVGPTTAATAGHQGADAIRVLLTPTLTTTGPYGTWRLGETMSASGSGQTATGPRPMGLSLAAAERSASGGQVVDLADDVFVEFELAPPEMEPPTEEDLGVGDVLGALLGAGRVRADLLPQAGGRLSLVAALVSGGEGGPGQAATASPLAHLLIDPLTGGAGDLPADDVAALGGPSGADETPERGASRALLATAGLVGLAACVWADRARRARRVDPPPRLAL